MARNEDKTKFCQHCGAKMNELDDTCPKCGVRTKVSEVVIEKKNPLVSAGLSFIITGLGQIYNGEAGKGIAFFILFSGIYIIHLPLLFYIFWAYAVYEAYDTAKKINVGEYKK